MRKTVVSFSLFLAVINLSAQPVVQDGNSKEVTLSVEQPGKPLAAPASDGDYSFRKGTLVFNAGVSVGLIGSSDFGYVGGSGFLPVTISGEYSLNELIGVSAYGGFYDRSFGGGVVKYSIVTFGGRLVFHGTDLLNDKLKTRLPERLDLYATLILGYRAYSWSSNDGSILPANTGSVTFGPAIGARYMLVRNFGVYLELGRGPFGVLGTGLSLKF